MSWDPMGVMEAEMKDDRFFRGCTVKLFNLGILSEPRYIPANAIFKGQPAQWWIEHMFDRPTGLLINAVDYTPDKKEEK